MIQSEYTQIVLLYVSSVFREWFVEYNGWWDGGRRGCGGWWVGCGGGGGGGGGWGVTLRGEDPGRSLDTAQSHPPTPLFFIMLNFHLLSVLDSTSFPPGGGTCPACLHCGAQCPTKPQPGTQHLCPGLPARASWHRQGHCGYRTLPDVPECATAMVPEATRGALPWYHHQIVSPTDDDTAAHLAALWVCVSDLASYLDFPFQILSHSFEHKPG